MNFLIAFSASFPLLSPTFLLQRGVSSDTSLQGWGAHLGSAPLIAPLTHTQALRNCLV